MKKNVSGQKIGAQMVSATDGSAFTGSVTVSVTGDAGTQATGSVGSGACTHEGNGYHTYAPAQAETNYDLVAFTFTGTGAVPATVQVFTSFPQTGDAFATATNIETDTQDIQSRIPAALVSGRIDASVGAMAANVLTATAINADAITAAKLASDVTTELQSGLATAANLATVAGYLDTEVAAILAAVDTEVAAIKAKTDNLPAAPAAVGDIPTAAAITDAVWDEAISGHLTSGTTGAALNGAGSAGDPWTTALPGAYGAGTAGYIVGTNLDAAVSSISGGSGLDAAGVRAAIGLASANLDTQLGTIDSNVDSVLVDTGTDIPATLSTIAGYLDTEIAAIKAKTDNLPSDPADQSAVEAAILAAWTTALTESYASNGAAFTPAQGLYAIHQMLMDFAISGTTISVKQLGGTQAFAVTLDDATTPTSASRA